MTATITYAATMRAAGDAAGAAALLVALDEAITEDHPARSRIAETLDAWDDGAARKTERRNQPAG